MDIDQELLTKVKKTNIEFKRLHEQHTKLKDRVEELNRMKFLTTEQEEEKKKNYPQCQPRKEGLFIWF